MAKTLQFRRGTTSELNSVTGSVGELFVNTEKDTVVVMDGSTSGGFELTQNAATQTLTNKTINSADNTITITESDISDLGSYITASSTDTLTNKTLSSAVLTGTLTAGGGVGTSGQVLKSTGSGVQWTTLTDNDTNTTYTVSAVDSGDDAIIRLTGSDSSTDDVKLVAGSNITITPSGDNITIASTSSADFSAVAEDVLPSIDAVYDLGSATKQWYDVFVSNSVTIDGGSLTGNTSGLVTDTILIGDLLITTNTITPDASTALQYNGEQGVVDILGNLDVSAGDWLLPAVVETVSGTPPLTTGTEGAVRYNKDEGALQLYTDSWGSIQEELVSGTNIKTVNGTSLLGSGDITISGGSGGGDLVDDTTPQLGGDLDLNSNDIAGTGDFNVQGQARFGRPGNPYVAINEENGKVYSWYAEFNTTLDARMVKVGNRGQRMNGSSSNWSADQKPGIIMSDNTYLGSSAGFTFVVPGVSTSGTTITVNKASIESNYPGRLISCLDQLVAKNTAGWEVTNRDYNGDFSATVTSASTNGTNYTINLDTNVGTSSNRELEFFCSWVDFVA